MLYDGLIGVALWMVAAALALPVTRGDVVAGRDVGFTAYLLSVWFIYLAICWRRGATLGMRAWRVRLVTHDGQPIGWGACVIRYVVAALSLALAGLGFWWSLWERRRRTWHDIASNSRLINI